MVLAVAHPTLGRLPLSISLRSPSPILVPCLVSLDGLSNSLPGFVLEAKILLPGRHSWRPGA